MKLSKRLETVASFVPKGSNIADIGTDHGYVPIYLVREGQAEHAVAMDVRKGPLERARAHVAEAGLGSRIDVRLSDGLAGLKPGEADCVVIAGMGGELIIHILEEGVCGTPSDTGSFPRSQNSIKYAVSWKKSHFPLLGRL